MKLAGLTAVHVPVAALFVGAVFMTAPPDLAAQEEFGDIEEIVVLARKREENVQDVPLSVTAISSTMIEQLNLRNLDDIAKVTAGLQFDPEFNRTSNRPVIRGQANILGDSGVSYFIDGVYITGSINDYDINDIERIEVVKGPQSALYGRNTYSGAINIVTQSPGDQFSGRVRASVTDDEAMEFSGTLKGPITDSLSAGITARSYQLDDAFRNSLDNTPIGLEESTSVSGYAVYEPNDNLRARFRAYYGETRDGQPALFGQPHSENNCFFDNGAYYVGGGRYFCGTIEPREIQSDWREQAPDATNENDTFQTSLSIDWNINDRLTLTSITGFNNVDSTFITEADYGPTSFQTPVFARFPVSGLPPAFTFGYVTGDVIDFTFADTDEQEDFSQELRLDYQTDRMEILGGVYYFSQETTSSSARTLPEDAFDLAVEHYAVTTLGREAEICAANPICAAANPFPFFNPPNSIGVPTSSQVGDIKNIAVFGFVAYDFSARTSMTVEARWAEEEIDIFSRALTTTQFADGSSTPGTPTLTTAEETFDSFNPRITIDHNVTDDTMVYALFASGNKPGGFNGATAIRAGFPTFDEEEVDSIEIGTKNTLADGRVTANVAMFFNQVDGYQLTQNVRDGVNLTSATVNAGDADIFGAEIEISARPTDWLSLMFNYAYTDTEFTSGTDENLGLLLDVADDGLVNCSQGFEFPEFDGQSCNSPGADNNPPRFGSIVGKEIPRTAQHQLFVDAEVNGVLGSYTAWDWFVGASYSYESAKYVQVANFADYGEASLLNFRAGVGNETWLFTIFGRNLLGEDSSPLGLRYADGGDSFKRSFVGTTRRDTHWGVTATVNF